MFDRRRLGVTHDEIGCLLRLRRSENHHARIVLKRLQPPGDVGGRLGKGRRVDAAVSTDKGSAHFRDEFLAADSCDVPIRSSSGSHGTRTSGSPSTLTDM